MLEGPLGGILLALLGLGLILVLILLASPVLDIVSPLGGQHAGHLDLIREGAVARAASSPVRALSGSCVPERVDFVDTSCVGAASRSRGESVEG